MKRFIFSILFATFFVACDKEPENTVNPQEESVFNENKIFTIDNGCATITYQCRIGNDFNSALDSLINIRETMLDTLETEGHYSGDGYNILKEKINVDFKYDSREFIFLLFTEKSNTDKILFSHDVIDEKGNYFTYQACVD